MNTQEITQLIRLREGLARQIQRFSGSQSYSSTVGLAEQLLASGLISIESLEESLEIEETDA